MKVTILDDYQDVVNALDCFGLLTEHNAKVLTKSYDTLDQLVAELIDSDALVLIRERTKINSELLTRLPKLKLISQTGKISNHLNLSECTSAGVAVAEGIGSPVAPTELCWALIMAATRHIPAYSGNLTQGRWQDSGSLGLGRVLDGLTLGIWGYGKIGKRIARFGKAFGMNVSVWGSDASRAQAELDGFNPASSKSDFFSQSDVLSLHLRLNEQTQYSVSAHDLKLMKPNALFVNISRAELVEPNALYNALMSGNPGFAALDVFEIEPSGPNINPLVGLANVLCTPHIGYVEKGSYELYFDAAFKNVVNFFNGQPSNIANPETLS